MIEKSCFDYYIKGTSGESMLSVTQQTQESFLSEKRPQSVELRFDLDADDWTKFALQAAHCVVTGLVITNTKTGETCSIPIGGHYD